MARATDEPRKGSLASLFDCHFEIDIRLCRAVNSVIDGTHIAKVMRRLPNGKSGMGRVVQLCAPPCQVSAVVGQHIVVVRVVNDLGAMVDGVQVAKIFTREVVPRRAKAQSKGQGFLIKFV